MMRMVFLEASKKRPCIFDIFSEFPKFPTPKTKITVLLSYL